jgi:hypothetical protein
MVNFLKCLVALCLALFLSACGHSLNVAKDPKTAIGHIQAFPPDGVKVKFLMVGALPATDPFSRMTYLQYATGLKIGSGFVIARPPKEKGLVVTNRHVVDETDSPRISFDNGDTFFKMKIVYIDFALDLAVLELPYPVPGLPLATSYAEAQGVSAFGYPGESESGSFQITHGTISNHCVKDSEINQGGSSACWLKHTAPIDIGSSGGPLVSSEYRVVGVNTGIMKDRHDMFIAIPADDVRQVVEKAESVLANQANRKWLTDQLKETCDHFVSELNSAYPSADRLIFPLSHHIVSELGVGAFDSNNDSRLKEHFSTAPFRVLQIAIANLLFMEMKSRGGVVKGEHCERVNTADDVLKTSEDVRVLVSLQDGSSVDLNWRFERGSWRLYMLHFTPSPPKL